MRILIATLALLTAGALVQAAPVITNNLQVVGGGGNIVAYYISADASYTDDVYFVTPDSQLFMFTNHPSPAYGTMVDLGYFPAGTDLFFGLFVQNTGFSFLSGSANNNPDNFKHAQVTNFAGDWTVPSGKLVCFEDQYGGGDHDCGTPGADIQFSLSITAADPPVGAPEPGSMVMIAGGLGLLFASKFGRGGKS